MRNVAVTSESFHKVTRMSPDRDADVKPCDDHRTRSASRSVQHSHMEDAMSTLLRLLLTLILSPLVVPITAAQVGKGTIQGHVTDSSGAVLQGASVSVKPAGARAVTDAEGHFTISGLPPGD